MCKFFSNGVPRGWPPLGRVQGRLPMAFSPLAAAGGIKNLHTAFTYSEIRFGPKWFLRKGVNPWMKSSSE
jgi:hypothetical protein